MKTPLLILVSVMTATLVASPRIGAQERGPRGPGPHGPGGPGGPGGPFSSIQLLIDRADSLGLSDQQLGELETIRQDLAEAVRPTAQALRELHQSGDRSEMRSKARPLMEELRAKEDEALDKALAIMDDSQRENAQAMVDAFRAERRRGMRRRSPGPRPTG